MRVVTQSERQCIRQEEMLMEFDDSIFKKEAKENVRELGKEIGHLSERNPITAVNGYNAMIQFFHAIKSAENDDEWDDIAVDFGMNVAPKITEWLRTERELFELCDEKKIEYEDAGEDFWEDSGDDAA